MKRGVLFVISGPSGVGKGTVIEQVMNRSENLVFGVSDTTRAPRPGEVDGVNYHYITREEFDENIKNGEMLEYTCYNGNCYGTPKSAVEKALSSGKNVLLDIEVEGAANVKRIFPECITLFMLPPSIEVLESRLKGRGTETEQQIAGRMARARKELELVDNYNYRVVNDEVDRCADAILEIIAKHADN